MIIQFGDGKVLCSWGFTADENRQRSLLLECVNEPHPIGAVASSAIGVVVPDSETVAMLQFSSLESARVFQDTVNEFICAWARDVAKEQA